MPTKIGDLEIYTLQEISEELKVTVKTLRGYIKNGTLKAGKIGKSYRVTSDALKEFLERGLDRKGTRSPGRRKKS
jgi:excisionase family DNA binding protein